MGKICKRENRKGIRWLAAMVAALVLFMALMPSAVQAMAGYAERKTVRVGFFAIDGYHLQDADGKKSGYGYEFLQMIAPYANFEYEYVGYDRSWADMQQMLLDGEIDMVTSAKRMPDREELFLYSDKSIGSHYAIFTVRSDNTKYTTQDYSTLDGMRVGLWNGNSQNAMFDEYAREHGFTYEPVYYDELGALEGALANGEIDGIVSSNMRTLGDEIVLDQFDREEFFVITRKGNDELMERVNYAISCLEIDTPDWKITLDNKYQNNSINRLEVALTAAERNYLEILKNSGDKLTVLVNSDLAPYSYFEDGTAKGIFVDLLEMAAKKVGLKYEIIETANSHEYLEAILAGKADIVFDAAFDYNTAERAGYYLTSPYYTTTYARVTRNNDNNPDGVAVIKDSDGLLGDRFLSGYINENTLLCGTFEECIKAVQKGEADYTYVFTYTASQFVGSDYTNSFAHEVIKEISCPICIAVKDDCGTALYSIMNKLASNIDSEQRDAAINANIHYNVKSNSFMYLVYNKPIPVILTVVVIMAGIIMLVLWFRSRERKAERLYREKEAQQKEALKSAYEAAERASNAKTDFLSGMSHDIRTPLNAIIGMVAIASAHRDDPARVSDCLTKITASSRHLLGLINEVLDMSRIESGKVTLTEEEFNLANLLDNLVQLVQPGIKAKNHELIIRINKIEHEDVIGDSLRIQQAFLNIVGNATKYTPDGGCIEIEVSEVPSKSPKVGVYKFVFKDNGIGMSPEYAKTIFEPFSREKDSRVDKIQGAGLGMAITKNIVQMMDGSIEVESERGKGSTFTVLIRLKLQNKSQETLDNFVGLPVLVVDDDESICESTCLMLDEIGMESEYVLSGGDAVVKVTDAHEKDDDFFAVIIDWKMPDMDGLATTKAIREAVGPDVPIIIFSAYDWSDVEKEARAAGVNAFISKPIFKSKLVNIFDEIAGMNHSTKDEDPLEPFEQLDFSGKNLLLVEDNDLNREIAYEILKMTGINIDTAEDGEKAVKAFEASDINHYDMILMDVQMPIMNGYDATLSIRALNRSDAKTVPIIAMTADAFAEDVEKAMAAQMNEHLAKPLEMHKLANVMKKWIGEGKK